MADENLKAGQKIGTTGRAVPMSEDERRFHNEWTKEDCIAELRKIAEANPDQVISRNFFRVNSSISESTWNRYFGTFDEFKRQAGIKLSRHAHKIERAIAKHASVDVVDALNAEKWEYAGKYKKSGARKHKTVLIGSDLHDIECDLFWRRCFIQTAERAQPDIIVLNGDVFDLPEFGKYGVDPRDWDVVGRIRWVHTFLGDLRTVCPEAEIQLVEGNHEFRLLRHLSEATPALKVLLSDLHGFTVPKLLGLDKFEVRYIAPADLRAFHEKDIAKEISRNYTIIDDAVIGHHFPKGREMGFPGWNGHHHRHIVWTAYSPTFGAYEWHQLGAGHVRKASYTDGKFWTNGFMLAHINTVTKSTVFEYIDLSDHAMIGGKFYERTKAERF